MTISLGPTSVPGLVSLSTTGNPPEAPFPGMLLLYTDTGVLQVYDGTGWVNTGGGGGGGGGGGAATVTVAMVAPPNPVTGHLWFNPTTSQLSVFDGVGWDDVQDLGTLVALSVANNALNIATGGSSTYIQGTAPWADGDTSHDEDYNDVWIDTSNANAYHYWATNNTWTLLSLSGAVAIAPGSVGTTELAAGAVTGAKIATGAVGATQIANGGVDTAEIAASAVTATQLATDAVTTAKLAAGAITSKHTLNAPIIVTPTISGGITVGTGNIDMNGGNIASGGVGNFASLSTTTGNTFITMPEIRPVNCYVTAVPVVSGGNSVFMTSAGRLVVHTSARKYKKNIKELTTSYETILSLTPVSYDYRKNVVGEDWETDGTGEIGFIADEAADLGLEELVGRNEEGSVETFHYYKLPIFQQVVIREQQQQIEDLTARIEALEAALTAQGD